MIKPYGTRCLVEQVKVKAETASGLLVDESVMAAPQSIRVLVLAVGPEVRHTAAGDTVLVSQYGPTEAKEQPFDKTLIVAEEDILGVIVPDKAS